MIVRSPSGCNLRWRELLSSEEIRAWVQEQTLPARLSTELTFPGVYRFIFPEARDGNSAHTPCYIGEGGNVSKRLRAHFRPESSSEERLFLSGKLRAGWQVRGAIRNSDGNFKLEVLTIEGIVNFAGLTFDQDTIPNPFQDSFLRRMLENWAILVSEYVDHLKPMNCPGTPHVLKDILANARKRSKKIKHATQK